MMMPPFAISFSSNLLTRTRSCRGVTCKVISLTSVQRLRKQARYYPQPTLRVNGLPVLQSRCFHAVGLSLLAFDFFLRIFLPLQLHRFSNCRFGASSSFECFIRNTKDSKSLPHSAA